MRLMQDGGHAWRFAHPTPVALFQVAGNWSLQANRLSQLSDISVRFFQFRATNITVKKSVICRPFLYSRARVVSVTVDDILFNRMNSNLMVSAGCEVYSGVTRTGATDRAEKPE
jgi:hypothetical protein